eukprot:s4638_g3.t2
MIWNPSTESSTDHPVGSSEPHSSALGRFQGLVWWRNSHGAAQRQPCTKTALVAADSVKFLLPGAVILISCCNLWNCVQIAHWRGRHTGPRERIRRPHRGKNWTAWDLPKAHWMDQATWQERQTQQV